MVYSLLNASLVFFTTVDSSRRRYRLNRVIADMESEKELINEAKRTVTPRLCRVSGYIY